MECGWRLSLHQLGKYERGKVEKRLFASLAATSLRLGQRLHLQSVIFGNFYWIKSPELSRGLLPVSA